MKRIFAAAALMLAAAGAARAGSLPVTLMATKASVDEICKTLPQSGVTCIPDTSALSPGALGEGALPLSGGDYFFLDRNDRPRVKGFLVLTEMNTDDGNPYYRATAKLYKSGFAGIGMTSTGLYDKVFWETVAYKLKFALPDTPHEHEFLAGMDDEIRSNRLAQEKREGAARIAAAVAASDAAYRASPAYAAEQSRQMVESCRATIVRARKAIAQDARVAQISGYENKLLREQAAVSIVNCEDIIARSN